MASDRLMTVIPARLRKGSGVRVIAPSRSLSIINAETRAIADQRFADLGIELSFGTHVEECDDFNSATIRSRVADIHDAFADPTVDAVITVIGGHNSNQLLPYLDWDLIAAHPKILCGYSDITALTCSVFARTGLVTYSGPHYSTFGMLEHCDETLAWFVAALFGTEPISLTASANWTDDEWFVNQHGRDVIANDGHWVLRHGAASGVLVGGNLCTLNLLHGTDNMPDVRDTVMFVEDDDQSAPSTFDRDLASLTQQPGFETVRGLLIGRFQRQSEMTRSLLTQIVDNNRALRTIPVIANCDFGHTNPMRTLPVGGTAEVRATHSNDRTEVVIR